MRLRVISIITIVGLLALLWIKNSGGASPKLQSKLLQSQNELRDLKVTLDQLRRENSSLKQSLEQVQPLSSESSDNGVTTEKGAQKGRQSEEEGIRKRFIESTVRSSIEDVGEVVDLTEAEKDRLAQALRESWEQDGVERKKMVDIVAEVLDPERSAQFKRVNTEREQKAEADEANIRVVTISRALGLSPDQELNLRASIGQIEVELNPKKEELKAQMQSMHSSKSSTQDRIQQFEQFRQSLEEVRVERRRLLTEKLQPTLSKAQFDKLVNEQASAPNGLFGLSNY